MTYKQISQMIASIGLPYAYYQFPDDTERPLPFICFIYDYDDIHADNANYAGRVVLNLELYTETKDFAMEQAVEDVLSANGLSWSKASYYIDAERMYQITYRTEVLING